MIRTWWLTGLTASPPGYEQRFSRIRFRQAVELFRAGRARLLRSRRRIRFWRRFGVDVERVAVRPRRLSPWSILLPRGPFLEREHVRALLFGVECDALDFAGFFAARVLGLERAPRRPVCTRREIFSNFWMRKFSPSFSWSTHEHAVVGRVDAERRFRCRQFPLFAEVRRVPRTGRPGGARRRQRRRQQQRRQRQQPENCTAAVGHHAPILRCAGPRGEGACGRRPTGLRPPPAASRADAAPSSRAMVAAARGDRVIKP